MPAGAIRHLDHNSPHGHEQHRECGSSAGLDWTTDRTPTRERNTDVSRPVIIDLYCCAGGASMGYHRAGFDVIGVDIEPQPRYPFAFHRGDALTLLPELIEQYRPVAVAASPPCQDHTTASGGRDHGTGWMLRATIDRLAATGLPYVVENVVGAAAHMPGAFTLCGRSFGIAKLKRHRLFLTNVPMLVPPCACAGHGQPIGVYGELSRNDRDDRGTHGSVRRRAGVQTARDLLDCQWMEAHELSQAIPPAYTQFIGEALIATLHRARPAYGLEGEVCAACHDWWPCADAPVPLATVPLAS